MKTLFLSLLFTGFSANAASIKCAVYEKYAPDVVTGPLYETVITGWEKDTKEIEHETPNMAYAVSIGNGHIEMRIVYRQKGGSPVKASKLEQFQDSQSTELNVFVNPFYENGDLMSARLVCEPVLED